MERINLSKLMFAVILISEDTFKNCYLFRYSCQQFTVAIDKVLELRYHSSVADRWLFYDSIHSYFIHSEALRNLRTKLPQFSLLNRI